MKKEFSRQYATALAMMEEFIGKCDEALWISAAYQNPAWRVCYHALFYTNIYLSPTGEDIRKWAGEREEWHNLKRSSEEGGESDESPYTRGEMGDFLEHIRGSIDSYLEGMEPERDCWPFWYSQNQLEFHMNNLRHLQHHTGELFERLNNISPISYKWR